MGIHAQRWCHGRGSRLRLPDLGLLARHDDEGRGHHFLRHRPDLRHVESLEPTTELSNVSGTATYDGDAAGVYVHETKKEDGTLDTATSGRFTADVALKAYFDGGYLEN